MKIIMQKRDLRVVYKKEWKMRKKTFIMIVLILVLACFTYADYKIKSSEFQLNKSFFCEHSTKKRLTLLRNKGKRSLSLRKSRGKRNLSLRKSKYKRNLLLKKSKDVRNLCFNLLVKLIKT